MIISVLAMMISIHAPAWGATHHAARVDTANIISIHAPAWGATMDLDTDGEVVKISIHAPAWGATGELLPAAERKIHFNPRSRVGSD